ncbi:trehalose-phosphate synthase [Peptococcaceae bacterium CEB3]|nr:trehalose-phosphate synthase [Peptococcaceae bacterium CEB3]
MRLLVVSNRLPVNVSLADGQVHFTQSTGGLVSGLSSYLDSLGGSASGDVEYVWIGWPGLTVPESLQEEVTSRLHADFRAHPVFLTEEAMDKFYHGFCNEIIWPLFHYFPSYAEYESDYWQNYQEVNGLFRDAVLAVAEPGDIIWVHDYHLMLLPKLLSEELPETPVGFFLHIPFPSYELFRLLPTDWGNKILEGLLGSRLIGFHTQDYTQHFLDCVRIQLGLDVVEGWIRDLGHPVQAASFPMGIDFGRFNNPVGLAEIEKYQGSLEPILGGLKTVLSIDRLDYSKGIVHRLRGYALFLEENPEWLGKVVLLLIVVPSRIGVGHYRQLKRQIDETVGRINGRFGRIGWTPINYQYKFLPFEPLLAMYRSSDVALITPLRDGMNLIAKEYISARADRTGVLILSHLAGAVKEASEALIINPNSPEEIAAALKEALLMPAEEQIRRNTIMQERFRRHNVVQWSGNFLQRLLPEAGVSVGESGRSPGPDILESRPQGLNQNAKAKLSQSYARARRRLILLDYDGTLVPLAAKPELAIPDAEVAETLDGLASDAANDVIVISGRERALLDGWFGGRGLSMVAEHGIWAKEKGADAWRLTSDYANGWQSKVKPVLLGLSQRLPGTFVEEKEYGLAWHYRMARPQEAERLILKVSKTLQPLAERWQLELLQGNRVLEVIPKGVDKGKAALEWLQRVNYDFIMAIGDDETDERMFRILPAWAYSVKVGEGHSLARFAVAGPAEVLALLRGFEPERIEASQTPQKM